MRGAPLRFVLLAATLWLAATPAAAQTFPPVPAQSVIGRMGIPGDTGPSQAIPFATLAARLSPTIVATIQTWTATQSFTE